MEFRIGINVGDVMAEAENLFGDGVNVAARVEGVADPGGICISGAVRDQIEGKLRFELTPRANARSRISRARFQSSP